ncbi:MAG: hypothetical protein AAB447_00050 [Patescibacteria group bacterium]
MHKIDKFLKKLTRDDRAEIEKVLEKISIRDFSTLDLKKMQGERNLYRIRKGNIRIIFSLSANQIRIQSIQFRNEQTYR